jgi:glycosyltransferase involved in cell wall biosynthesis
LKVLMHPHPTKFGQGESGIRRVVEAYHQYLPVYDIELVTPDTFSYDLVAVHAGMTSGADVAHNHGLYWTEDIPTLTDYEWQANVAVINSLREAKQITVPSEWVAKSIRRDMRINPHVIGHGVEWQEWQGSNNDEGYILWNKNRDFDVCNPEAVVKLARIFPKVHFLSTFAQNPTPNLKVTGQVPFEQMKQMILGCSVYLSSIKETFGIGTLEAMAAGKPILGWANGGNLDLVEHGVNGYLAVPGNYEDLANGLDYCLSHRKVLGENGREMSESYTWADICQKIAEVYRLAYNEPKSDVGIVIPVYKKSETEVVRAIESCLSQTARPKIVVVDDGSNNGISDSIKSKYGNEVTILNHQHNQGVAVARNNGISKLDTKYIACLDADDWLEPAFLEVCIAELEKDRTIGIAYTGLKWHNHATGESKVSDWPGAYQAKKQFDYEARSNQIPTCCVFRKDAWERTGGYRSRYCPEGAGSEDAAFWSQILSQTGYTAKQVTIEPLFNYSLGGQVSSNKNYHEIDWLAWLPYSRDKRYPFACSVLPDKYSHPVRQYDEPELSIIIPVGPGHENDLRTALDSIEAQHYRNWEAVVILDTGNEYYPALYKAYPYVKWGMTDGKRGAGHARNCGAKMAKGKLLLFLDADDFINPSEPNAIGEMLIKFQETGSGIYSAHIGRAVVSPEYAEYAKQENRLLAWNEKLSQAYILNHGIEFDCEKAFREPGDDPNTIYIWNLISTLIPRQWHFEIGGFDESMPTWEDWDYWLRMAKIGHCFTRIQKPYFIYNYISGNRREAGRQIWADVLKYIQDKHNNEVKIVGCGCGGKKTGTEVLAAMDNEEFVLAWYIHPNGGKHHVIINGYNYGRHSGARREKFPVRKADLDSNSHLFEVVAQAVSEPKLELESPPEPIAPPVSISSEIDFSEFRPAIQTTLRSAGIVSAQDVKAIGLVGLTALKGIGQTTAKRIMELAE